MSSLPQEDVFAVLAHEKGAQAEKAVFASEKHDFVVESGVPDDIEGDAPTDEEKRTLPRVPGHVHWRTYLIALIELAERFSYYGTIVVFTNFVQQPLPSFSKTGAGRLIEQSGALGLGQRASTAVSNANNFWIYVTPILGALIADLRWGRFKTVLVACYIALVGHVLLVICAVPQVIAKPAASISILSIAIVIMGLGTGAFKSNISPLIAEQAAGTRLVVKELSNGKRVIEDPAVTTSRVMMRFYLCINVGALAGQLSMVYAEHYVGFWLSYLLPTIVLGFCPFILLVAAKYYKRTPPNGSALVDVWHMIRSAGKGKWSNPRTLVRSFWSDAKPSTVPQSERPSWMTYDDRFVDEVRRGFKACALFFVYPLYWLCYNQISNNLTSQAAVLNTHGLPNDILQNLNPLALLILCPLCDFVIYPALRRAGIQFTPIERITAGFFVGALAMLCAALVQNEIYKRSACGYSAATCEEQPFVDLNVWVQTPSYVLIALSEVFASITGLELAYTKAPKSMRSLVTSVFLLQNAFSSAIGFAFVSLSNDPLLIWNYGVVGCLAFIAGTCFYLIFRRMDQQENALNEISYDTDRAEDVPPSVTDKSSDA